MVILLPLPSMHVRSRLPETGCSERVALFRAAGTGPEDCHSLVANSPLPGGVEGEWYK